MFKKKLVLLSVLIGMLYIGKSHPTAADQQYCTYSPTSGNTKGVSCAKSSWCYLPPLNLNPADGTPSSTQDPNRRQPCTPTCSQINHANKKIATQCAPDGTTYLYCPSMSANVLPTICLLTRAQLNTIAGKAGGLTTLTKYVQLHAQNPDPAIQKNCQMALAILAAAKAKNSTYSSTFSVNASAANSTCSKYQSNPTIKGICKGQTNISTITKSNLLTATGGNKTDAIAIGYVGAGYLSNFQAIDAQYVAAGQLLIDLSGEGNTNNAITDVVTVGEPVVGGLINTVNDLKSGNVAGFISDVVNDIANFVSLF